MQFCSTCKVRSHMQSLISLSIDTQSETPYAILFRVNPKPIITQSNILAFLSSHKTQKIAKIPDLQITLSFPGQTKTAILLKRQGENALSVAQSIPSSSRSLHQNHEHNYNVTKSINWLWHKTHHEREKIYKVSSLYTLICNWTHCIVFITRWSLKVHSLEIGIAFMMIVWQLKLRWLIVERWLNFTVTRAEPSNPTLIQPSRTLIVEKTLSRMADVPYQESEHKPDHNLNKFNTKSAKKIKYSLFQHGNLPCTPPYNFDNNPVLATDLQDIVSK